MDIQCIYEEGGLTLLTDIQMLKKIKLLSQLKFVCIWRALYSKLVFKKIILAICIMSGNYVKHSSENS